MAESYAIIETGGKQYRAEKGTVLVVDRISEDEGAKVTLRPVMFSGDDKFVGGGADLEKVKVEAEIVEHLRGEKIKVFKYKAKKGYRKRRGHRSSLTKLEVKDVKMLTRKPAAKKEPAEAKAERLRSPPPRRLPPRSLRRRSLRPRSPRRRSPLPRSLRRRSRRRRIPMAHKKGLGSSRNGRDSNPKMLGVKIFAGQEVGGGEIIVRQRGTRFRPGDGTGIGKDHTIFATRAGKVDFKPGRKGRVVSVSEAE